MFVGAKSLVFREVGSCLISNSKPTLDSNDGENLHQFILSKSFRIGIENKTVSLEGFFYKKKKISNIKYSKRERKMGLAALAGGRLSSFVPTDSMGNPVSTKKHQANW